MTTVGDLITYLQKLPAGMPVAYECCSDWRELNLDDIEQKNGVRKDEWVMRAYDRHVSSMSQENRANIEPFLILPGN